MVFFWTGAKLEGGGRVIAAPTGEYKAERKYEMTSPVFDQRFSKSTNLEKSMGPPHLVSTNAPARYDQRNNVQYTTHSAAAAHEGPRVAQTYAPVVAA